MKLRAFYLILLVALCVSLLPGCSAFAGKAAIGVIETSGSDATSQIVLFDKDLNKVSGFPLAEASLNSVFYDPVVNQGILYAIPQGYAQEKEARKVLGISIQDGSVADYSIDQPAMNSAAVSERYIFACNTLNGVSHISRCEKKSNQVISIEEDNSYVSSLLVKDNKLYSFSSSLDGGESWIDCYDFDLNRIFRIETTEYGSGVYRSCVDGGSIYFVSLVSGEGESCGAVFEFNTATGEIKKLDVPDDPIDVELYDGKLYVTHGNMVERSDYSAVTIVNHEGEMGTFHFKHGAVQTVVNEDGVYVLDSRTIYCYSLDGLKQVGEASIDSFWNQHHYISGLFSVAG